MKWLGSIQLPSTHRLGSLSCLLQQQAATTAVLLSKQNNLHRQKDQGYLYVRITELQNHKVMESQNPRMVCVGRHLEDHPIPTLLS